MKQGLHLKVGQSLTMTPQLQQAIRLLQLSSLEIQQEIQQSIESNPMLELVDEYEDTNPDETAGDTEADESSAPDDAGDFDATTEDAQPAVETGADGETEFEAQEISDWEEVTAPDSEWQSEIPEELPVDSSWDDVYTPTTSSGSSLPEGASDFEERTTDARTLQEHLLDQVNLLRMSDRDREIALAIVDAVEPDGLLRTPLEELCAQMTSHLPAPASVEDPIELDEVTAVLHMLQNLDPTGVFARDLRECMLLQLKELDAATPWRDEAIALIENAFEALAARDLPALTRRTRLPEDALIEVIRLIQSLNPRPGADLGVDDTEYVVPDVFVRRDGRRWLVELNPDTAPRLRINQHYASLVKRADDGADNQFLRDNLQEARWFLKSLQSRNETLLRVASCIVERQRAFLEYGPEAMRPLVLHDIAEDIGMHESTISRVTTRKYMYTPQGIFELKYFFSSHVSTASGGEVSSTAIRALIRKLTDEENPRKPLSDARIAHLLAEQDIQVARRTIAKYRESMAIPPSNERKRLV